MRSKSHQAYYTRALQARDPRYRQILEKLPGFDAPSSQGEPPARRGRPPKAQFEPKGRKPAGAMTTRDMVQAPTEAEQTPPEAPAEFASEQAQEGEDQRTRAELLREAERRGLALPPGYISLAEIRTIVQRAEGKDDEGRF